MKIKTGGPPSGAVHRGSPNKGVPLSPPSPDRLSRDGRATSTSANAAAPLQKPAATSRQRLQDAVDTALRYSLDPQLRATHAADAWHRVAQQFPRGAVSNAMDASPHGLHPMLLLLENDPTVLLLLSARLKSGRYAKGSVAVASDDYYFRVTGSNKFNECNLVGARDTDVGEFWLYRELIDFNTNNRRFQVAMTRSAPLDGEPAVRILRGGIDWADGGRFVGEVSLDGYPRAGNLTFPDGNTLNGQFHMPTGAQPGHIVCADGRRLDPVPGEGHFVHGVPRGTFDVTEPSGRIFRQRIPEDLRAAGASLRAPDVKPPGGASEVGGPAAAAASAPAREAALQARIAELEPALARALQRVAELEAQLARPAGAPVPNLIDL